MNNRQIRHYLRNNMPMYVAVIILMTIVIGLACLINSMTKERLTEYYHNQCEVYGLDTNCLTK